MDEEKGQVEFAPFCPTSTPTGGVCEKVSFCLAIKHIKPRENMRAILGVLLLSVCMLASGCMSFDVENHPKGMDLTASSPKGGIETIHGSFYGFKWKTRTQEDIIKASGVTNLYRVTYHSNFFYSLAAVCSLGLYVPETIEWKLVTAPEDDGPVM